jgi:sugar/nucleoside kinase (ribokinase family)
MTSPQVLISGYPSFDLILRVNRAPQVGETGIILDPPGIPSPTPGGCAGNIAVCLARLGIPAAPSLILGDDEAGLRMAALLQAEKVLPDCLTFKPGGKTAVTFLFINPQGSHQTFYFPGCADEDVEIRLPPNLVQAARFAVITVASRQHTERFLRGLEHSPAKLVWSLRNDPHAFPPGLVERLLQRCRILVMNRFEQQALMGWIGVDRLQILFERGLEALIVTLGEEGSLIYEPGGVTKIPAVAPQVLVDPTGAGDAFLGGLLSGLCYGYSLEISARIGAVTASFVLEAWGCQTSLPKWEQMVRRYYQTFHEYLPQKDSLP